MKTRYELRCLFTLALISLLVLDVACAPADLGSEVTTRSSADKITKATLRTDSCVKIDEKTECSKETDSHRACFLPSGTEISIVDLNLPYGYSIDSPTGRYLSASAISVLSRAEGAPPAIANEPALKPSTKSRLEAILAEVSNEAPEKPTQAVPAGRQSQEKSNLSLCNDDMLRELATKPGLGKHPLKLWSKHIEFEPGFVPQAATFSIIFPASGVVTSQFGWRWGRMHNGLDIANSVGTPIVSAQAGSVTYKDWHDGGYGYLVELDHGGGFETRYAHMNGKPTIQGSEVAQGAILGLMGSTGRSTGPHLHFEVRANKTALEPRQFLAPEFRKIGNGFSIGGATNHVPTDIAHSWQDADLPIGDHSGDSIASGESDPGSPSKM